MKKKHITVLLLAWLFSQQLFAAVWAIPNAEMNCVAYNQSDCTANSTKHMGHTMPMMDDSDAALIHDMSLMNCDLCSIVCQPSLITSNLLPLRKTVHLTFQFHSINIPIDILLGSLYRPPILV